MQWCSWALYTPYCFLGYQSSVIFFWKSLLLRRFFHSLWTGLWSSWGTRQNLLQVSSEISGKLLLFAEITHREVDTVPSFRSEIGIPWALNKTQKIPWQNLTPKKSHAEFPSHKNFQRYYVAGVRGKHPESSDWFEYPNKSLLTSSYPKNTCQNFPTQKNPEIENFKPQKILPSSLSLEIRSTPSPTRWGKGPLLVLLIASNT